MKRVLIVCEERIAGLKENKTTFNKSCNTYSELDECNSDYQYAAYLLGRTIGLIFKSGCESGLVGEIINFIYKNHGEGAVKIEND